MDPSCDPKTRSSDPFVNSDLKIGRLLFDKKNSLVGVGLVILVSILHCK